MADRRRPARTCCPGFRTVASPGGQRSRPSNGPSPAMLEAVQLTSTKECSRGSLSARFANNGSLGFARFPGRWDYEAVEPVGYCFGPQPVAERGIAPMRQAWPSLSHRAQVLGIALEIASQPGVPRLPLLAWPADDFGTGPAVNFRLRGLGFQRDVSNEKVPSENRVFR